MTPSDELDDDAPRELQRNDTRSSASAAAVAVHAKIPQLSGRRVSGVAGSTALAKKRLLPMELRRRRRAAKLLGTATTEAAVEECDGELEKDDEQAATRSDESVPPGKEDAVTATGIGAKRSASEDPNGPHSIGNLVPAVGSTVTAAVPLSRSTSAVSRLSSFYNWSAVDRKRQRVQNRALADVPSKFHPNDVRWHCALRYFAHPATPLPVSITLNRMAVATQKDAAKTDLVKDELAFYASRLQQWQEALRDAYFGFRDPQHGGGDGRASFYVRSSDFVVCFYQETPLSSAALNQPASSSDRGHPLLDVCLKLREQAAAAAPLNEASEAEKPPRLRKPRLCAVVSQSTARIRKALHHLNVSYAIPYSNARSTAHDIGHLHLLEAELVAMEATARPTTPQQHVHGADSLLYFSGHQAVHGLYEFLVNRKPLTKEDVPEVYARHPFANAAIKSLNVKYMGAVAAGLTAGSEASTASAMFRTEISGFCFPSAVSQILEILADEYATERREETPTTRRSRPTRRVAAGDGDGDAASSTPAVGIRAYMEPAALTERFNSLRLSPAVIRMKSVSGTTLEERERWNQELELSKRRVENVVVRDALDEDDVFEVETTARASPSSS
ncbi:hypothetical protein PybrP1_007355 [[Pythium] brassicae (nom. inval.)]|nr:hypothetical protein PybrP1_007355 [[Pythium] brassicae (nom. inval.)]